MEYTKFRDSITRRVPPSDLFPALAVDEEHNIYVFDDNYIGFAFICEPLSGIGHNIDSQLNSLFNSDWPTNTFIQTSLFSSPDIYDRLFNMSDLRGKCFDDDCLSVNGSQRIASQFMKAHYEFLERSIDESIEKQNNTRLRNIQILITVKFPSPDKIDNKAFNQIIKHKESTQSILNNVNLQPVEMDPDSYVRIMSVIMNGSDDASWRSRQMLYRDDDLLRNQFADASTAIEFDDVQMKIGERHVRTLSVKRMPHLISLANTVRYLGDPFTGSRGIRNSMVMTLSMFFGDQEAERSKVENEKNALTYQASGQLSRFVNKIKQQKSSIDILSAALEDGDRVVRGYLSFVMFSDDEESATRDVSNCIAYYRDLGFQLQEDRLINLPVFLNSMPFGCDKNSYNALQRFKRMGTRHATSLLPISGDWKGLGGMAMPLVSRNGQLMGFDLFSNPVNANSIVSAESGSGKSFFMNALIMSYVSMGAKIFAIDAGRSYKSVCELLGGDYIDMDDKTDISLNPFANLESWVEESDILMALLISMIERKDSLSDEQTVHLRKFTKELWDEHKNESTIELLAEKIDAHRNEEGKIVDSIQSLALRLYEFTPSGEYGHFFSGDNVPNFKKQFTVLELDNLQHRKHLQKVVLVQLISIIQRQFFQGDRKTPQILIVDESWELLTSGEASSFLEASFRKFRKYNASAIILTQSINDVYQNERGRAMAENASTKLLLGQTSETIESLKASKRIDLSEGGYELLKSVHKVDGQYSEVFIHSKYGSGIGRLIMSREMQLFFTTNPVERNRIDDLVEQGHSEMSACKLLAKTI
ncbi:MAG: type IV secretion system protein TraC [Methylococcales bacterium]|jgi:conjugal transfer ATP-binding protein TraC|nr:type IV secretion system protein TraC [Methylococcales bacterium]